MAQHAHAGAEPGPKEAEWERQIESLDQRELELHQTQFKLIREQTTTFVRDLSAVRQEVATVKQRQASVEKNAGDSQNRPARCLPPLGLSRRRASPTPLLLWSFLLFSRGRIWGVDAEESGHGPHVCWIASLFSQVVEMGLNLAGSCCWDSAEGWHRKR